MALIRVNDLADRRLDVFRHLKQTNETSRRGLFIAEGDKLVRRLLASGLPIESILLSESYVDLFAPLIPPELPVYVVADENVETLVGFNFHRGILACGRRPSSPASLLELLNPKDLPQTVVVCPDVQDPENLGAIIRIALGFGVDALVLGPNSADPFSRRVQRVSMGGVYRLPIVPVADCAQTLIELRTVNGIESWATVLAAQAETLDSVQRPTRLAIVFGSEGHGLADDVVAACDRRVTIPMRPDVDSLNVAVAAGIFLYELTARR